MTEILFTVVVIVVVWRCFDWIDLLRRQKTPPRHDCDRSKTSDFENPFGEASRTRRRRRRNWFNAKFAKYMFGC